MSKTVKLGYTEIKNPFAFLSTGCRGSTCVFFEIDKNTVACWNDLRENYPRWIFSVQSHQRAMKRIIEMVKDEGWELVETSEEKLTPIVRLG